MTIIVVSWNLNHRVASPGRSAWDYLADQLRADVALVQEAGAPPAGWQCVGDDIGGSRRWGTRVVSPRHPLSEVTEVRAVRESPACYRSWRAGTAATATTVIDGRALTFVSLYGLMEPRNAYPAMYRHLADLAPLLDAPDHFRQTIVGGDLNLTSQWDGQAAGYAAIDRALLDSFPAWGLRDLVAESTQQRLPGCPCDEGEACRHRQTLWQRNERIPRQNDYLFASKRLLGRTALTIDEAAVHEHQLSDHAPLVLTIDR